jgi:hypothetical protein
VQHDLHALAAALLDDLPHRVAELVEPFQPGPGVVGAERERQHVRPEPADQVVVGAEHVAGPPAGDAGVDHDVGQPVQLPPDPLVHVLHPAALAVGVQHRLGDAVPGHHPGHRLARERDHVVVLPVHGYRGTVPATGR